MLLHLVYFCSFVVGNLFAYRSKNVSVLANIEDTVGADNDSHIKNLIEIADILVPCWGSRLKLPKSLRSRCDHVLSILLDSWKPVMAFGITKSGDPMHPMMLAYATELVPLAQ